MNAQHACQVQTDLIQLCFNEVQNLRPVKTNSFSVEVLCFQLFSVTLFPFSVVKHGQSDRAFDL